MIPAALPVVPISLSLLARYVKEKRGKKGKNEKRKKKPTAFYFSFQIIHSEQHLSSAYVCVYVCPRRGKSEVLSWCTFVPSKSASSSSSFMVRCSSSFVVLCPEKSNLMDTTCLLVDASYAVKPRILTLPPQKGGKKKEKRKKEFRPFACSVRIYSRRISMRFHSARNGSDSGH